MELKLKQTVYSAELIIESGFAKVIEEVSEFSKDKGAHIPESKVLEFFNLGFDAASFNGQNLEDAILMLCEKFLDADSTKRIITQLKSA